MKFISKLYCCGWLGRLVRPRLLTYTKYAAGLRAHETSYPTHSSEFIKKSVITCTRKLHFDAAHRIVNHESKCKFVHGHRYVVEAGFVAQELDSLGRVVDFGVIKEKLSGWIDEHWDHNVILWDKDKELGDAIAASTGQKVFYLSSNPTAENIAAYLFDVVAPKIFADTYVKCIKIRVYETPNCFVDVE